MANGQSAKVRLRRLWFQVHKWIGLILAPVVIVVCLTGSALVWHDWLDEALNPERSVEAAPARPVQFYADAARSVLAPGDTLLSLAYPESEGAVTATVAGPPQPGARRPVRTQLYLHPGDGRVLDRSASNEGAVFVMHVLHGSLMVPGIGRQIVGWIGVAMLISALTGLWLWWPFKGGFVRGLRWKRMPTTSGNLHHQGGFWIAIPLAVLSFTGAWISFPGFFGAVSGESGGPPPDLFRRMSAAPVEQTAMTADQAILAARPLGTGELRSVAWPTDFDGQWTLAFARDGGRAEIRVEDATGAVSPAEPPPPESTARLMRRIHDGTDTGVVWQVIIFLGGLVPSALAVTGIMMWLRARRVRGSVRAAFAEQEAASQSG